MSPDDTVDELPVPADEPESRPGGIPLYLWVIGGVVLAVPVGLALGVDARWAESLPGPVVSFLSVFAAGLDLIPKLIIRALGALAAPLVVLAILSAILTNDLHGRQAGRMMLYYLINTIAAMIFGLVLTNVIQPGRGTELGGTRAASVGARRLIDVVAPLPPATAKPPIAKSVSDIFLELVPRSIGDAFAQNNLAQLVLLTLALGIGMAQIRNAQRARGETSYLAVVQLVTVGFELLMKVLLWVVAVVPIAVFCVVASNIAREGFELFLNLGWFIVAVLVGLACQVSLYCSELGLFARLSPLRFLRGAANVMATTFSTASTAATMPITLKALTSRLGVSKPSSQLAACVGTNFNNDGTALYQAAAALFFAQALGRDLSLGAQVLVVLTTLVASVGAGGIPSGSFVTMPLIFAAVDLPADALPILLTVDWFLDRCRTTSNVLGDMTVAVLLDLTEPTLKKPPATS